MLSRAGAVLCLTALTFGCGGKESPPPKKATAKSDVATPKGPAKTDAADLILHGGRVYTLAWPEPDAEGKPSPKAPFKDGKWNPDASAIAIKNDRIVFVGDDAGAKAKAGPETKLVDLKGAVAIPGLVDAHTHVVEMGLSMARVDLVGVPTPEAAVEKLAARAAELPPGAWLTGQGFDEGEWANAYPDRKLLDARIPDRPVYVRGLHGFAGWLNSRGLEMAKITRDTKDPVGGKILRDAKGEPNGMVVDNAVEVVDAAVLKPTDADIEKAILDGLNVMAKDGFVSVHEAGMSARNGVVLQRLEDEGRLPIRFYGMLRATDPVAVERYLAKGPEIPTQGYFTVRAAKAFYDGSLGARGASLLEDYADKKGHRGTGGAAYDFDPVVVEKLVKAGFQVGIHAIGDAGNRETLDFFEKAGGPRVAESRHRIEHAQVVHPDDFARFKSMAVIASVSPPHAVEDMDWAQDRLGAERIKGAYAWRTFRKLGVALASSSDLPGSDHNIFYGLHASITRRDKDKKPEGGWRIEEALSPEEALRAYTSWAAFASFTEKETGVLAPGRWADVTVMTVDPLALGESDPGKLLEGEIRMTIVGGKIVHQTVG